MGRDLKSLGTTGIDPAKVGSLVFQYFSYSRLNDGKEGQVRKVLGHLTFKFVSKPTSSAL